MHETAAGAESAARGSVARTAAAASRSDRAGAPARLGQLSARAAEAVRAGFLAAADAAEDKPLVIEHGDGDVMAAFAKARAARRAGHRRTARARRHEDARRRAASICRRRSRSISSTKARRFRATSTSLTLTIDSEARAARATARATAGAVTVAVIASDTPRQQRFASAFNAEWILAGRRRAGDVPLRPVARRAARCCGASSRKTPVDAALLAVDAADAALREAVRRLHSELHEQRGQRAPAAATRCAISTTCASSTSHGSSTPDACAFAGLEAPRLSEPGARAPLRARHGRLPRGAGVRGRHAVDGSSSTAPRAICRSTRRASSSARAG